MTSGLTEATVWLQGDVQTCSQLHEDFTDDLDCTSPVVARFWLILLGVWYSEDVAVHPEDVAVHPEDVAVHPEDVAVHPEDVAVHSG